MRIRLSGATIVVAAAAAVTGAVISTFVTQIAGQTTRPARIGERPNFSGIWQANNEAHWDLQAHAARAGAIMRQGVYPFEYAQVPAAPVVALGAAGGVPGSLGVVQGDGGKTTRHGSTGRGTSTAMPCISSNDSRC